LSTSSLYGPYFISRELIFEKVLLPQNVKEAMPNEGKLILFKKLGGNLEEWLEFSTLLFITSSLGDYTQLIFWL
jgi:hypothetical protein